MIARKHIESGLSRVADFQSPVENLEQYITPSETAAFIVHAAEMSYEDLGGKIVLDIGTGTGMLAAGAAICNAKAVLAVDIDPVALQQADQTMEELDLGDVVTLLQWDATDVAGLRNHVASHFISTIDAGATESSAPSASDAHSARDVDDVPIQPDDATECESDDQHDSVDDLESKGNVKSLLPPEESLSVSLLQVAVSTAASEDSLDPLSGTDTECSPFDTVLMNPPFGTRDSGADVRLLRAALQLVKHGGAVWSLHKTSTVDYVVHAAASGGGHPTVVGRLVYPLRKTYGFHRASSHDIDVVCIRTVRIAPGQPPFQSPSLPPSKRLPPVQQFDKGLSERVKGKKARNPRASRGSSGAVKLKN